MKTLPTRGRGRATVNSIHSTELWAETNFLFFSLLFTFILFHHFSTLHRIASASDYPLISSRESKSMVFQTPHVIHLKKERKKKEARDK